MRNTPSPSARAGAKAPSPQPIQPAGQHSGEGCVSVMEHLIRDRQLGADNNTSQKERNA